MNQDQIRDRYFASITPQELALELLGKADAHILRAEQAFQRQDFEEANNRVTDAQDIFAELGGMMRGEDAQSRRAAAFFSLLEDELFYADVNLDLTRLREVRVMTGRLRAEYAVRLGKPRLD